MQAESKDREDSMKGEKMSKPVFEYTVSCQACGWSAPQDGYRLSRTAMEEQLRYHRHACLGPALATVLEGEGR